MAGNNENSFGKPRLYEVESKGHKIYVVANADRVREVLSQEDINPDFLKGSPEVKIRELSEVVYLDKLTIERLALDLKQD